MGPCPLLWPLCVCGVVKAWEWWKTTRISMLFAINFLSSFCMSVSFYPHSFSLVVRVWSGGFLEPLFSVACSASGPVRNSLVILGFCSFVVGPQFKTTSLFQFFCNPSFHKDVFLKPHPHQANCPNFHFVLSMPLLRLCQWRFLQSKLTFLSISRKFHFK